MEYIPPLLTILIGIAIGGAAVWLLQKERIARAYENGRREVQTELVQTKERLAGREESLERLSGELDQSKAHLATSQKSNADFGARVASLETELSEERRQNEEKLELLKEAETKLADTFKSLAAKALSSNNESFLTLAKTKLQPMETSIKTFDKNVRELETAREGAYKELRTQVVSLTQTQKEFNKETTNLVSALRSPTVRGRWGEVQLKRVVELAGMLNHCDFREQHSVSRETGGIRPDLLVQLPAGKNIIVDSKVPLNSYLEALEAPDENSRQAKLADHAKSVRSHIRDLSSKSYFEDFDTSPEFVVLFIASEAFFSAALEQDPGLIEVGAEKNVIIATPTTLIALLRAVAYGWRQEQLAENAKDISDLGKELYKRLSTVSEHVTKLGKSLSQATDSYNKAVGSLETRVLVTARKLNDLHVDVAGAEIAQSPPVDKITRQFQAEELLIKPPNIPKEQSAPASPENQ